MEVKRRDIFIFMLEFDESNFAMLKVYSDKMEMDMESALKTLIVERIANFGDIKD